MQFSNLDDLNEKIKSCNKCSINATKHGFQKTLGQGAIKDVKIFFVCQKPHTLKNISTEMQAEFWKKYGSGGFFSYNLRFYRILAKAQLLKDQEETLRKLDELSKISLKADPEKWWTTKGRTCRELLRQNGLYLSEAVKCPTPQNRRPKISELRNCSKWLREEIKLLNPKIVCLLGRDAQKSLGLELTWGQAIFATWFPGQYAQITDATRIEHFKKLRKLSN